MFGKLALWPQESESLIFPKHQMLTRFYELFLFSLTFVNVLRVGNFFFQDATTTKRLFHILPRPKFVTYWTHN